MGITKTTKRLSVSDRPQRRRSGLKAIVPPLSARRTVSGAGHPASAAAGPVAASAAANVRVVVRVRPENERERQGKYKNVVRPLDDHMLIFDPRQQDDTFFFQGVRQRGRDMLKRASKDVQYIFDRVFHPHHTNQQLFEATTRDVVDAVLDGFNCSVFAYGSTGAGKTYTMLGGPSEAGIIFLTVMELYSRIEKLADQRHQISVSYVEVYNETVTDLLSPSGPLDVREDGLRAVVIAGLSQLKPDGPDHLMTILESGNKNRTQHATDMNAESSRSHAVFQVVLKQSASNAGLSTDVRTSKLSLIDLAGSERGSATGHKGARFREGANINRSLLALGSCINALADGKKFVPYRDSKLTRLLKDSIGGNCKTVMIAAVTPSSASYEDTHNTLKYADRAKAIKTRLQRNVVSVDLHVSQYVKLVEELRAEVSTLRGQLAERPAPPPAEPQPAADYTALRTAEAERRRLLTHQLQLGAEQHQLRLRLHRRRMCVKRAGLLRLGDGPADRLQQRLAGRLADSQPRLETALTQLTETAGRAAVELDRVPAGPHLDQLMTQLNTERHLGEARVHASHLEAVCRLQQHELAAQDQLLDQLVAAVREQYRVLGYMGFVSPKLEAQYKEVVGLVEGQKEVCWADQQSPPANSPGQPSYDVTALLKLTGTSYAPAESVRHAIGSLLRSAPPASDTPAHASCRTPTLSRVLAQTPVRVGTPSQSSLHSAVPSGAAVPGTPSPDPVPVGAAVSGAPSHAPAVAGADAAAADQCAPLDASYTAEPMLETVLPPSDTTLGCCATDEALICADPGPVGYNGRSSQRPSDCDDSSASLSHGVRDERDRDMSEVNVCAVAVSVVRSCWEVTSPTGLSREATPPARLSREATPPAGLSREATPPAGLSREATPPAGLSREATLPARLSREATPPVGLSREATPPAGLSREATPPAGLSREATPPVGLSREDTPPVGLSREATPPAGLSREATPPAGLSREATPPAGLSREATPPAGLSQEASSPASSPRWLAPPVNPSREPAPSPQLGSSQERTASVVPGEDPPGEPARQSSLSHKLETNFEAMNVAREPPMAEPGPGLNCTLTLPAASELSVAPPANGLTATQPRPAAADLDGTQTLCVADLNAARTPPSPDLNATRTLSATDLNVTRTLSPPDLNGTRVLPAAEHAANVTTTRALPAAHPSVARASPASVDLNATRTLSGDDRVPEGAPFLPAFGASPIPADRPPFDILQLPSTPEILRRARTPLKARAPPAAMDATFSVDNFRAPVAVGGVAGAGGGGARVVAGRPAVKPSADRASAAAAASRPTASDKTLTATSAAAAARLSAAKRAAARLAPPAPSASRLSLSAQKSKSVSRLHSTASGRDENSRPDWGRATTHSLPVPTADKTKSVISSVGKFGLGRHRNGAMAKSRSTSVLKSANS